RAARREPEAAAPAVASSRLLEEAPGPLPTWRAAAEELRVNRTSRLEDGQYRRLLDEVAGGPMEAIGGRLLELWRRPTADRSEALAVVREELADLERRGVEGAEIVGAVAAALGGAFADADP
ncbi:MAG: hypothetical protein AAGM22_18680, partial [Acidobacteriota bacterium]